MTSRLACEAGLDGRHAERSHTGVSRGYHAAGFADIARCLCESRWYLRGPSCRPQPRTRYTARYRLQPLAHSAPVADGGYSVSLAGGLAGTIRNPFVENAEPMAAFSGSSCPRQVSPDARVYGIAVLLSIASGMLPGLLPARQIFRTDALQAMKRGAPAFVVFRRMTLRDLLLASDCDLRSAPDRFPCGIARDATFAPCSIGISAARRSSRRDRSAHGGIFGDAALRFRSA